MLTVAEQAYRSDTGRQRSANEDSLFVRSPLFVVADGMGGAQAGEVASKIAAESFEPVEIDPTLPPERFLREIVEDANRRIHDLSQRDASRSGMGTTLTAALVHGDEISIAHVGDSRAYIFRGGELRLLTSDHSLVEELRRQGRLTAAQAEDHPQRSIITRALGPEAEVEVDTMTYKARAGDVFILCSDGLTTMVKEPAIESIAAQSSGLDDLATKLIRAANDAGGRDNITVIAFRVDEAEVGADVDQPTLVGPSAEQAGLTAEGVREGLSRERSTAGRSTAGAPVATKAKRNRTRSAVKALIAAVVIAAIIVAGVIGLRHVYFLGTDDSGRLSLYRGLPYDLPLGVDLYSKQYSIPILADSVPEKRRDSVTNHELRSHDDAVSLLNDLETAARSVTTTSSSSGNSNSNSQANKSNDSGNQSSGGGGSAPSGNGSAGSSGTGQKKTSSGGNGSATP